MKSFPVEKEYAKNPDISKDDIRKMREWLNTQPHLPAEHLTGKRISFIFILASRSILHIAG